MQQILEGMGQMRQEISELKGERLLSQKLASDDGSGAFKEPFQVTGVEQAEVDAREAMKALKRARRESRGARRESRGPNFGSGKVNGDEKFDGYDEDVSDQFTKKLKAVMAMMSGRDFDGTKKSHRRLITRLKMAFKMHGMRWIVNDDPEVWETFLNDPDNAKVSQMSEMVLESVLESILDKGAAYTKFKLQKRVDANNVRAMYDAVRGAHKMSTTKLTKRKLKKAN